MIIKNVIVYTEDKKFTAGGIVVHDDKIESIYTTENVPDMPGEEVVDGQGAYAEGSGSCRREHGRPVHQPGEKRSAG